LILNRAGYEVVEATSGIKGYALIKNELPDLVLLDIMLPDIDGFEVMRKLRLDERTKHIPIVFVSAVTAMEHIERGLSLGAQGYITKPFKPQMLLEKVSEALEK